MVVNTKHFGHSKSILKYENLGFEPWSSGNGRRHRGHDFESPRQKYLDLLMFDKTINKQKWPFINQSNFMAIF